MEKRKWEERSEQREGESERKADGQSEKEEKESTGDHLSKERK